MSNTLIDGLIASTVFTPGAFPDACTSAYMRNCAGVANPDVPDTAALGRYKVIVACALDLQKISINARAYNAAGSVRNVTVIPTVAGDQSQLDMYVRDDAGALSEDFVNCEVTVTRLPL
jgi:hypothetical protein